MIQAKSFLPGTRGWFEQVVEISLFTNARALPGDKVEGDRQGCWDDAFLAEGETRGSRLWLLKREKITQDTQNRAKNLVQESLAWLVRDSWCKKIDVTVTRAATNAYWFTMDFWVTDKEKFTLEMPYAV